MKTTQIEPIPGDSIKDRIALCAENMPVLFKAQEAVGESDPEPVVVKSLAAMGQIFSSQCMDAASEIPDDCRRFDYGQGAFE